MLGESWELVEHGHITEEDYRDFVFAYPAQFYTNLNKDFFKGTRVESRVVDMFKGELAAA